MLKFFIPGEPKPQGRPRAMSMGKFTKVYSPTTEWKEAVKFHAAKQRETCDMVDEAMMVTLRFYLTRPKSHWGTGRNAGTVKPSAPEDAVGSRCGDVDNLAKAVLDAMQDAKLISDDRFVIGLNILRQYALYDLPAGCKVTIQTITEIRS